MNTTQVSAAPYLQGGGLHLTEAVKSESVRFVGLEQILSFKMEVTPDTGSTMLVQTTDDSLASINAGTAVWDDWPVGSTPLGTTGYFFGALTGIKITGSGSFELWGSQQTPGVSITGWSAPYDGVKFKSNPVTGDIEILTNGKAALPIDHGFNGVAIIAPGAVPGQYTIAGQAGSGALVTSNVMVNGEPCIRIQNPTVDKYIEIASPLFGTAFTVGTVVVEAIAPQLSISIINVFVGDATYTNFATSGLTMGATTVKNDPLRNGLMTEMTFGTDYLPFVANGAYVHGMTPCQNFKLRINPQTGAAVDIIIRRFAVNPAQSYGRLAIISDDNYSSWETMGVPIMDRLGLHCSVAVIPSAVGISGVHSNLDGLRAMLDSGHEMVMHGPNGLAGSLIDNYGTTAQRMGDVLTTRAYLESNGLKLRPRSLDYYVYPQGKFQEAAGDSALVDAMIAAGITGGRTAAVIKSGFVRACMSNPQSRHAMPIIGHSWASAGTEAANITAIKASITELAARKLDGILMFHQVVADGAESSSLHIGVSNFRALMEHISATCAGGALRNAYVSDFA